MSRVKTAANIISIYKLEFDRGNRIVDRDTRQAFNLGRYSRMKYGDREATRLFAAELAGNLIDACPGLIEDVVPPEFITSFMAVPHVPYYLCRYSLDVINGLRLEYGNEPGRILKVYKSKVATTNYAEASKVARHLEWQSINLRLDNPHESAAKKIIVDDIRITGAAEQYMLDVFKELSPEALLLGYVAVFDYYQASLHPDIEDHINGTSSIKLEGLLRTIEADNFDLNIRTLKLILDSETDQLLSFLVRCPARLVCEMLRGTVSSGLEFANHYEIGYRCLQMAAGGLA